MSLKHSYAGAFRAITAAFLAAESEILGSGRVWHATNAQQERLLSEIFPATRPENNKLGDEIKTKVAWIADPINAFLKEAGMDIQLEPLGPDTFAFAAVMKVTVQWVMTGTKLPIKGVDGKDYPGAKLKSEYVAGRENLAFYTSPRHGEPIVTLRTKSADVVHLTKFGEELDSFDLIARSKELLLDAKPLWDFGGVRFPLIDFNVQPNVGWLLEMWTMLDSSRRAKCVQAIQQCKLQMNHIGAIVQDAFAGALTLECMPKPDLVINDDFLFVLERPGLSQPVFTAVLRPDAWKDPGELTFA